MPRARAPRVPAQRQPDGDALTNLDSLDQDPAPVERRPVGRPRKAPALLKAPGKIPARNAKGQIMSPAQMQAQVNADAIMYLGLARAAFELRDPHCAAAIEDKHIEDVAARMTRLIARNDKMLALATQSGVLGDVLGILGTVLPIAGTMWKAHGPGGTGHQLDQAEEGHARTFAPHRG